MRILAGVDWSDEAFATVEQIGALYRPEEVVLVHGVDLGMFQSPLVAGALNVQGYDEFRQAMIDAGRQAVERCSTLLPAEIPSIRTLCEVQHPAAFILDSASAVKLSPSRSKLAPWHGARRGAIHCRETFLPSGCDRVCRLR